jgi:hypothetical protein
LNFFVDLFPQDRPDEARDQEIEGDRGEDDEREPARIDEHHPDEHEREHQIEQRGQTLAGQKAADRLQFAHARDCLPRGARLEIGERQSKKMMKQPPAEFDVDAVGGVAQSIGAQELEDCLEEPQRHHAEHQHDQSRHALVNENLVDHELEKDRGGQRQLHEQ